MSRLDLARPAVRPQSKARMVISGPPGCGKTRTALIVADVLAEGEPVLLVDSQRSSALAAADDFTFEHLPWGAPFDPRELGQVVVEAAPSHGVVVVDSLSPFWRGPGGVHDIAYQRGSNWGNARSAHAELINAVHAADVHFVGTVRTAIARETVEEAGRWSSRKIGMAPVQDDDLEYDVELALEQDMDHALRVVKSTLVAVPVGEVFGPGRAEDFAVRYRDWLADAEPLADAQDREALLIRMNALPSQARRSKVKQEFLAQIGLLENVRLSQLGDAWDLVVLHEDLAIEAGELPARPVDGDAGAGS